MTNVYVLPYIRAYILVYVHKELYTFAYVVPETVVFYTTTATPPNNKNIVTALNTINNLEEDSNLINYSAST